MALDLKEELESLVAQLDAGSVPFAICGGVAVTIHGAPRLTEDLDLLVPSPAIAAAKVAAAAVGFDQVAVPMTFGHGTPFERTVHRVSKLVEGDLLTLDLIVVGGFLEPVWEDRVIVEWETRRVHVVSRSGLLSMKRAAGRPKDLLDIAALEGSDEAP